MRAGLPPQQLRDVMHRKSKAGELLRITPERFALRETMEMLRVKAEETARNQPDGLFTAAQYRDVIGVALRRMNRELHSGGRQNVLSDVREELDHRT